MKIAPKWLLFAAFSSLLTVSACSDNSSSGEGEIRETAASETLSAANAWLRAGMPEGRPTAGYVEISNYAKEDNALVGASSPRAGRVEIHTHTMDDMGVMRMRQVDEITVPADRFAELRPGRDHLMFFELTSPITAGEQIPVTLKFQNGSLEVLFEARAMMPDGADNAMHPAPGAHDH